MSNLTQDQKIATQDAYQLLKDINNAAGNRQPYTAEELDGMCGEVMEMISKAFPEVNTDL